MNEVPAQHTSEHLLAALLNQTAALSALLITRCGTVLAQSGEISAGLTALAAEIGGMLAVSRSFCRTMGAEQFSTLLLQGEQQHVYISTVTRETVLVVVFEGDNLIGLVRHAAGKLCRSLAPGSQTSIESPPVSFGPMPAALKEHALTLIDRLFDDMADPCDNLDIRSHQANILEEGLLEPALAG